MLTKADKFKNKQRRASARAAGLPDPVKVREPRNREERRVQEAALEKAARIKRTHDEVERDWRSVRARVKAARRKAEAPAKEAARLPMQAIHEARANIAMRGLSLRRG